ncbi:MAG: hypothetical protein R3263_09350 [Myxococcota bacterium]|nr:hypothetical protein [Myxococcota bacterium]
MSSAVRGPRRAAVVLGLAGLALAPGLGACAGGPRPWEVPPERRARFEETRRVCHVLTDGEQGGVRPQVFDRCMERRGFQRVPWWKFWN